MTPSCICASCGCGDHVSRRTEHGQPLCARCAQRVRLGPVDLQTYRQHRPAGPVPRFTGPQEPGDVIRFPPRQWQQAESHEHAERDRHETPGSLHPGARRQPP